MGSSRPLNIGIFFNARREQGGLYQYALTLIHCLHRFDQENFYTLYLATMEPFPIAVDNPRWVVKSIPNKVLIPQLVIEGVLLTLARLGMQNPIRILPRSREIDKKPNDIMVYVKPTPHTFLWPYRFVFPIHDLQHRFQKEFPEVSTRGEGQRRDYLYQNSVPRAAAILTDSEVGKEDVIQSYGADPTRVHPLPYLAPTYLTHDVTSADIARVRSRYRLPDTFLFYPASFWPHKNHSRLIRALDYLRRQENLLINLVFAGGPKHEFNNLTKLIADLELRDQIHFVGYVGDDEINAFYHLALGLVMPTFFGPTNIPILEAWALECPVITSDVRGLKEQAGNAAILIDPRDEKSIAQGMKELYLDVDLRERLIRRGLRKVSTWTPKDLAQEMISVLHIASN